MRLLLHLVLERVEMPNPVKPDLLRFGLGLETLLEPAPHRIDPRRVVYVGHRASMIERE